MNIKLQQGVHQYLSAGWKIVSQTDTAVQLSKKEKPHMLVVLLLFLCGIFPALLYLFWPRPEKLVYLTFSNDKVYRVAQ